MPDIAGRLHRVLLSARPTALIYVLTSLACATVGPPSAGGLGPRPTVGEGALPGGNGLPSPTMADGPEAQSQRGDDGNAGAEALLAQGFAALRAGRPAAAAWALSAAVGTQDLSEAGRALAYWHIYVAEQALGAQGHADAALADFLAVGEGVLGGPDSPADPVSQTFVDRFDLRGRLARGRATQSLAWSRLAPAFGHSRAIPVPIVSDAEMQHFIALAPPCAGAPQRVVAHRPSGRDDRGHPIAHVTLSCAAAPTPVHYFFSLRGQ